MTSFSFTFEQRPSGSKFITLRHGVTKDATADERDMLSKVWNAVVVYANHNKIAVYTAPEEAK